MSEARHIISNAHAEESIVDVKSPDISAIEVLNEDAASDRDDKNDHELDRDTSTRDLSQYINLINASKLISSPYPDLVNQLTFPDLSLPVRLFAIALSSLTSTRDDYATAPYLDSFNWDFVFALLRTLCILTNTHWQTQDFYVVTFHSKLHRNIDRARLGLLDQKSHEEACASGGLLKYWFGSCDGEMRNLATCVWRNRQDAAAGGSGPWHRQARLAARDMYEKIEFRTYRLVIEEDVRSWRLENYAGR